MLQKNRYRRLAQLILTLTGLGLPICPGLAQENPGQPSLLKRSPFIPPDFTPGQGGPSVTTSPTAQGNFELRGIYQLGKEYRFLVGPAQAGEGDWVQLGKSYEDYEVRRYDSSSETLTLYYNNEETQITLTRVEANPTPIPVSGQVQPAAAAPAPRPSSPRITRRAIRPVSRTSGSGDSSPPPWLEKLREEAAARRAQAAQSRFDNNATEDTEADGDDPERTRMPLSPEELQELKNSAPHMGADG